MESIIENESSDSISSTSSEYSVEWEKEDIVQLLRTHYAHLLNSNEAKHVHESNMIFSDNSYPDDLFSNIICQRLNGGMENYSIKIEWKTQKCKYLLRIYLDPYKTREYIAFELDAMYKLRQILLLPVPCIIETTKFFHCRQDIRDCIVEFKGHWAVVFEFCEGFHMKRSMCTIEYIQAVGSFIGSLHRHTLQYADLDLCNPADHSRPYLLIDERIQMLLGRSQPERLTFEFIWQYMNHIFNTYYAETCPSNALDEKAQNAVSKLFNLCHKHLKKYSLQEQDELERKLPRSLNHGDSHRTNILFVLEDEHPKISSVVDWDDTFIGPCIIDFVNNLFFWCIKITDAKMSSGQLFTYQYVTEYVKVYVNARGFGLTNLEKEYCFDYLYLTLFFHIYYILKSQNILTPCNEPSQYEDYQNGREMVGYFLTLGSFFETEQFKKLILLE
jgi:Ser/Thr protein kinase RdoA (MazF antagonist)